MSLAEVTEHTAKIIARNKIAKRQFGAGSYNLFATFSFSLPLPRATIF